MRRLTRRSALTTPGHLALAAIGLGAGSTAAEAEPPAKRMPKFKGYFADMAADYYKLAWTHDGYPGQMQADGTIWEHPLYPVFVLDNYLAQYDRSPSRPLREAITTVAHAAVSRMGEHEGALVRWYEPGHGARLIERHFSALTQSYYAERLWLVAEAVGDRSFKDAARRGFRALTVPRERGGVLYQDANGPSLALVPQAPNSYILNGWLSALVAAWDYHLLSGDDEARALVEESTATVERLLPSFDAPEVSNARYGLTGFAYLRTREADLAGASVIVPGEGAFALTGHDSRWANHRIGPRMVNLVFSLASSEPNRVVLDVDRPTGVEMYLGEYDPLTAQPVGPEWTAVGRVTPEEPELEIPRETVRRIVHPTNFVKVIDGAHTNVYYTIHIDRLRRLAEATGRRTLAEWADRWEQAMCRWGSMPMYQGLSAIEPGGPDRENNLAPVPVSELCQGDRARN